MCCSEFVTWSILMENLNSDYWNYYILWEEKGRGAPGTGNPVNPRYYWAWMISMSLFIHLVVCMECLCWYFVGKTLLAMTTNSLWSLKFWIMAFDFNNFRLSVINTNSMGVLVIMSWTGNCTLTHISLFTIVLSLRICYQWDIGTGLLSRFSRSSGPNMTRIKVHKCPLLCPLMGTPSDVNLPWSSWATSKAHHCSLHRSFFGGWGNR